MWTIHREGHRNKAHEVVPVSQNRYSNDKTAAKQFLITWMLFGRKMTTI